MHGENHFENDKHAKLDQRFPSARNEVHHPARRFQHQKRQPEMAEDAEGAAAATPVDFQLWFDFRFEDVQMFVNAAGGHAPQLAVNQCQVGENGQREAHQHDTEEVFLQERFPVLHKVLGETPIHDLAVDVGKFIDQ